MRTRSFATSFLTFSAAAMLVVVGAGTAHSAPPASDKNTAPTVASARVDNTGAAEYWTSDRMLAAVPGEVLAGNALGRLSNPAAGNDKVTGKDRAAKVKASKEDSGNPKFAQAAAPVAHIGKVFFTMAGQDYVCSGNAVTSFNESTVATAGHCVNGAPGVFAMNFAFVPGYDNGNAPYGRWTARALYTTPQWEKDRNIAFDTGFAVMDKLNGQTLTGVVGSSDVDFGAERALQYTSYGYPASKPYDGKQLWSCTGTATDDPKNPQFLSQGIPCTMTGGSSGGPWLLDNGVQNSVNSYGYNGAGVMYGPYWGDEIEDVYDLAEAA